jgi:hypothetical protein
MKKDKPDHPYHGHHHHHHDAEQLRLEAVTVSVGFDDMLDVTLRENHAHFDNFIVVTAHDDKKTQSVARKYSATIVQTDLFKKNGRGFNKGAAINAGMDFFQFHGWRLHLDSDIVLPDNFRRLLFNHTHLETQCIYGCDRLNVIGRKNIDALLSNPHHQHHHKLLLGEHGVSGTMGHRLVCDLRGYLPLGFFQLWNARTQKPYPHSLGNAAHDDMMFSASWPLHCRRHLASVIVYHLCPRPPKVGENWDGNRKTPRLD